MRVDEVTVFRVVLHTCADAAPHALVHLRVDAVREWAQRGEIDVTTCFWVLCGHDVVPHRSFVEVRILGVMGVVEEVFGEFQHVVGVARLGTLHVVDVELSVLMVLEVLADGVTTDADSAVLCHIIPEVQHGATIVGEALVFLPCTFETDVLRNLSVGVLAVEEGGVEGLHAVNHLAVAVLLSCIEIFLVAKDGVGIHQSFVHAAMFRAEHLLHLLVGDVAHHVDAPIGKTAEEFLRQRALGVEISIAKTSQHLVLTVEGHPSA